MLANSVSPPEGGTFTNRKMLAIGGSESQDTSECQVSPAVRVVFSSACRNRISGCDSPSAS